VLDVRVGRVALDDVEDVCARGKLELVPAVDTEAGSMNGRVILSTPTSRLRASTEEIPVSTPDTADPL
jgi:hypothetical protein